MAKKKVSKKKRDVNLKNIIVLLVIVLIGLFIWVMVAQGSFDEGEELGAEGELAQAAPRVGGGGGMIHLWKFEGDLNDSIGRADKKEVKGKTEKKTNQTPQNTDCDEPPCDISAQCVEQQTALKEYQSHG